MTEKKPIPIYSVISLSMIASIQVSLGIALVTTGFGATVGMGLIT